MHPLKWQGQSGIQVNWRIRRAKDYKVRSRYLNYHKVRSLCDNREIEVRYCPTESILADILIKPIGPNQFARLKG